MKDTLNQQQETDNSERIKVRSFVYNKSESGGFDLSSHKVNKILTDKPNRTNSDKAIQENTVKESIEHVSAKLLDSIKKILADISDKRIQISLGVQWNKLSIWMQKQILMLTINGNFGARLKRNILH